MIDACSCSHSNVANSGVTRPNLTKFLHDVEEMFPFNLLKSKLRSCNPLRNVSVQNECVVGS